ncbi:glutamate-5-semialdehyde dehydrogenase [Candidatus Nomurabacteria bacterium]|nr:glutamate-5-semialdehyde dehydrogenase [Candidatus Nomurabacteria bacterium]
MKTVIEQAQIAKNASHLMRKATTEQKNTFLKVLATLIEKNKDLIIAKNTKDLNENQNITPAMKKRLTLSEAGLAGIVSAIGSLVPMPDPVGVVVNEHIREDGLKISRVRAPIGVIVCIFESRPNVIVDVAALCIKSGNVAIVRGGKEAFHSNNILLSYIQQALQESGLPQDGVQQLEDRRHEAINELIVLDQYIDLVIPRGRKELIDSVTEHSKVPVIKHARGLCHAYIDRDADIEKAIDIVINAKTSNPATCNSVETVLVHKDIADSIMPKLLEKLFEKNVEVMGDERTCTYSNKCRLATEDDWDEEYLDLKVSIKIVDSYDEAIAHISKYSSSLTDSIVSENNETTKNFQDDVDSAVVLVNASNRLTDGEQFGLGGEIGISTCRIHMRGPMGLEDMTVTKYVVVGDGHIRK